EQERDLAALARRSQMAANRQPSADDEVSRLAEDIRVLRRLCESPPPGAIRLIADKFPEMLQALKPALEPYLAQHRELDSSLAQIHEIMEATNSDLAQTKRGLRASHDRLAELTDLAESI